MRKDPITKYRGKWAAVVWQNGERKRFSTGLDATPENREAALRQAENLLNEIARAGGNTCADIVPAYIADRDSRADKPLVDKARLENAWKALKPTFAQLTPKEITRHACRDYVAKRRREGRAIGTIRKELSTLRTALNWYEPKGPHVIELPPPPLPRDRHLSREEFAKLLAAAEQTAHLKVFLHLAIATAARKESILDLTWSTHIDLERGRIWMGFKQSGKKRATVPITRTLRPVLVEAAKAAQSDSVVEWAGGKVGDVKTAFRRAVTDAGIAHCTIHDLRHTAAVWMREGGVELEKIKEYLGHEDLKTTESIYAKYGPDYLADAADALEL